MASVVSLGLHEPTALHYLIDEGLLTPDPPRNTYTWQIVSSNEENGDIGDDELLVTKSCVVWSRGGLVRKSFRFDIEEEPVTQALLTYFNVEHNAHLSTDNVMFRSKEKARPHQQQERRQGKFSKLRSKALVIFLKTQAHIYFLSGGSHVIHLPFEVESAVAAPNGLVIQRKLQVTNSAPGTLKFPRVPPGSFVSSQTQPWSAKSSQQSNFSITDLGSPQQLPMLTLPLLGDLWEIPKERSDASWPRLFSLTDPLTELGLIVSNAATPVDTFNTSLKRDSLGVDSLSPSEEILYVSELKDLAHKSQPFAELPMLAVTFNRDESMYTVWKFTYVGSETASQNNGNTSSRRKSRRSSFAPGTGATTPVAPGQLSLRESFGGNGAILGPKSSQVQEDVDPKVHFESSLDPDFETSVAPKRQSRRVSSMIARTDLSSFNGHSAFEGLATGHQILPARRNLSMGSLYARNSVGGAVINSQDSLAAAQLNQGLNGHLEAPVDSLLEELKAGGDFEGFHSMGLDDDEFEGLRKEIVLTKIKSVPAQQSGVRFSSRARTASSQCKIFMLCAPHTTTEDRVTDAIVLCVLDPSDKKLLIMTLHTQKHVKSRNNRAKLSNQDEQVISVLWGDDKRAEGVLDACKLNDGDVSRILVLTETADGYGELTLQAPWTTLIRVSLPGQLSVHHFRSLGNSVSLASRPREHGLRRVISQGPKALVGLQNPKPEGVVDIIDNEGRLHQIQIRMRPRNPQVGLILDVCQLVLPGVNGGEGIMVSWCNIRQWLKQESIDVVDAEYSALVIVLFTVTMSLCSASSMSRKKLPLQQRNARTRLTRTSSGAKSDSESWMSMMSQEAKFGGSKAPWMQGNGWGWIPCEEEPASSKNNTIIRHVALARAFMASPVGQQASGPDGYLPTSSGRSLERRQTALSDLLLSLHLLHEEQKLYATTVDSVSLGLAPIIAQICKWMGWRDWSTAYDVEGGDMSDDSLDSANLVTKGPSQPKEPDFVYEWIQRSLVSRTNTPFMTFGDIIKNRSSPSRSKSASDSWSRLTPRTAAFAKLFAVLRPDMTSAEFVEAMLSSGMDSLVLETLPEALSTPMREAITDCQAQPPIPWSEDLFRLIGRDDLNSLAEKNEVSTSSTSMNLVHESNLDVHIVCSTTAEPESIGSFDGSAEIDRQTITRLIFKDDRRFAEASKIMNTSRPTIAFIEAESEWTDSDLLEAQKEHVQMLAVRTLAIPAGRGLLYFSARIPLLTEKFPIAGFNLHCIMKPNNNTVAVDKSAFTEEKVCWAFFHAGVSAGLSISREAKGIDTSWISYNKPNELTNRHAGFLLGLGLNGHLKSLAKWVAFKYLTPKHAMTSIGLLLGLAASKIGTMDSLVTRLLSVHVTRMLPPGAAELNLSPLTQATGIMGIGLLYCNTQHRRMSEIMLSEMEHAEPEPEDEQLRNEAYRLSAGFALGFINLGKGSDLKGLHDMRLTERLLVLAVGNKRVNIVHVLDKATAAAVISIALIFMKSGNEGLAQKIDVPDSALQFDYIRPDTFMLRTLAKHMILWDKIEPSMSWVENNLPEMYKSKANLKKIGFLCNDHLPLYNIISGLCFSIALRFAGSGSTKVRDLVLHYLDQMIRICRLPASSFDEQMTRNTIRNCQDLLSLCAATVMAGTGDLAVFRRLRSMHGRDDSGTPYGSHLAAHLAIGTLFMAGGSYTFGTTNLAVAALIVAFYPIFPSSILDNNSHLQAFRHFWVIAVEPRCLIVRDFETNLPISVPLVVTLRSGEQILQHTPCLLPELDSVSRIDTQSPEYWNVVLDFEKNPKHLSIFQANQSVYIRRRPAHDASTSVFQATLQALGDKDGDVRQPLEWIFDLPAFTNLTKAERALVLPPESNSGNTLYAGAEGTVVDTRLILESASLHSGKRDRLLGLRLLFDWADSQVREGRPLKWIRGEVIEALRASVWTMASGMDDG